MIRRQGRNCRVLGIYEGKWNELMTKRVNELLSI